VSVSTALLLPAGTQLPPLPYLLGLIVGLSAVLIGLWRRAPGVTDATVLAIAPWIVLGGVAHGAFQLGLYPSPVAPLFGTVAVYLTLAVVTGLVWLGATVTQSPARILGGVGGIGLLVAGVTLVITAGLRTIRWTVIILVVTLLLTIGTWRALSQLAPNTVAVAGWTGVLVVFGHAIDGVSTAVVYDALGATERTPVSALLLEIGAAAPGADIIGAGWLFVLVKLAVAAGLLVLFRTYLEDRPREARLLLVFVASVGLGPAVQNLVLATVGG